MLQTGVFILGALAVVAVMVFGGVVLAEWVEAKKLDRMIRLESHKQRKTQEAGVLTVSLKANIDEYAASMKRATEIAAEFAKKSEEASKAMYSPAMLELINTASGLLDYSIYSLGADSDGYKEWKAAYAKWYNNVAALR